MTARRARCLPVDVVLVDCSCRSQHLWDEKHLLQLPLHLLGKRLPRLPSPGIEAPPVPPFFVQNVHQQPISTTDIHKPGELLLRTRPPLLPFPLPIHADPKLHQKRTYTQILEHVFPRRRLLDPPLDQLLRVLALEIRIRILKGLLRDDLIVVHALFVTCLAATRVLVDDFEELEGGARESVVQRVRGEEVEVEREMAGCGE